MGDFPHIIEFQMPIIRREPTLSRRILTWAGLLCVVFFFVGSYFEVNKFGEWYTKPVVLLLLAMIFLALGVSPAGKEKVSLQIAQTHLLVFRQKYYADGIHPCVATIKFEKMGIDKIVWSRAKELLIICGMAKVEVIDGKTNCNLAKAGDGEESRWMKLELSTHLASGINFKAEIENHSSFSVAVIHSSEEKQKV